MKSEDLLDAVGGIDSSYVEAADKLPGKTKQPKKSPWGQWGLAAAALLLVFGILYFTLPSGVKPDDAPAEDVSSDASGRIDRHSTAYWDEDPSAPTGPTIVVSLPDVAAMILDSGIIYKQTTRPYEGEIPNTGIKTVTAYEGGDYMAEDAGILVHDGACNFDRELKTQYFRIDDARIAVKYNGAETWVIYCDKDRYQEFYPAPSRTPEEMDPTYGLTESSASETVSITFWD